MTLVKVCKSSEVNDDSLRLFNIENREIVVGKRNGKLFACDAHCPHRHAYLHKGWFNGNNIVCPLHNYEFDVSSGKLMKMTSWKENNPTWYEQSPEWRKSGDLPIYKIKIKNGDVYVDL
jgi:3-phenylpropionate/trans-cinnamate dioxygenase ferredoxin subunit